MVRKSIMNTLTYDKLIETGIEEGHARKDKYLVTDNGYSVDRETYVNLSYVYSDQEIKSMSDEDIVAKTLSSALLYNEYNYKDDIQRYSPYSIKTEYKNVTPIRRMTRNRAVELAVKEVDYKGNSIKVYYDYINNGVFKTALYESDYAYLVYNDTEGITLNVFKVAKNDLK